MTTDNPAYRDDWRDFAACAGMGPEFFYQERGEDLRAIKAVCHGCPVRLECLEHALATGEVHGVWGGMSERARKVMRRDRRIAEGTFRADQVRKQRPPCGTDRGYAAHGRWMEKPCEGCLEAHRQANRLRADNAKSAS